jgi:hypothetical protein
MTPHPVGRDAQVSGPSMHAAETSMACGQRLMVGRSSSITERLWPAAQAAQTMTMNGRSVPRRGDVKVSCSDRSRRDQSRVGSLVHPFCACRPDAYHRSVVGPG